MTKKELKALCNLLDKYCNEKSDHLKDIKASDELHEKIVAPIRTVKHRVANEYYELSNKN